MTQLDETERDALVLRYFEDRSLREVGQELGISEDAARMRVNRALEKLRTVFATQGITVTSVLLGGVLAASTTTAAVPAGLSAAILAAALAGAGAAATTATHAILVSMFSVKTFTAAVGAALLAGTGIYLVQQGQIDRLKAENQEIVLQRQQSAAAQEAASRAAQAAKEELARSGKDNAELLRLRNEVGQLRRERDARQRAAQQAPLSASAGQPAADAGPHISKDQLAFAGYATPEAALRSVFWALANGKYEQAMAGVTPEVLQHDKLKDPQGWEQFRSGMNPAALPLKGMQIVAQKALAEGKVELEVRLDYDLGQSSNAGTPPCLMIERMVKVGNGWKVGSGSRQYDDTWNQDGRVEVLAK